MAKSKRLPKLSGILRKCLFLIVIILIPLCSCNNLSLSNNPNSTPVLSASENTDDIGASSLHIPGLPENFDENDPDMVKDYFLYLLQTGQTIDIERDNSDAIIGYLTIEYCNKIYQSSLFRDILIKIDSIKTIHPGYYELVFNIPENNSSVLAAGEQIWHLRVMPPVYYGDTLVLELVHESKGLGVQDENTDKIYQLRNLGGIKATFSSPIEIPDNSKINYLLSNVPPSGQFETSGTYITQEDINKWAKKLFGVSELVDQDSRFYVNYEPNNEYVYTFYIGWDPPIDLGKFIYSWAEQDEINYYYEIYPDEYISLHTLPCQILQYKMKGNIVWSCEDVTDSIGISPYFNYHMR